MKHPKKIALTALAGLGLAATLSLTACSSAHGDGLAKETEAEFCMDVAGSVPVDAATGGLTPPAVIIERAKQQGGEYKQYANSLYLLNSVCQDHHHASQLDWGN